MFLCLVCVQYWIERRKGLHCGWLGHFRTVERSSVFFFFEGRGDGCFMRGLLMGGCLGRLDLLRMVNIVPL